MGFEHEARNRSVRSSLPRIEWSLDASADVRARDVLSRTLAAVVQAVGRHVVSVQALPEVVSGTQDARPRASGILLGGGSHVVTRRRVAGPIAGLRVRDAQGRTFAAETIDEEAGADCSLLELQRPDPHSDSGLDPVPDSETAPSRAGSARDGFLGAWRLAPVPSPGDTVIAIGYGPHPILQVTAGVVLTAGRMLRHHDGTILRGLIQHTARIPREGAGGPLVDRGGRLIGIATAGVPAAGGTGFAVALHALRWSHEPIGPGLSPHAPALGRMAPHPVSPASLPSDD